MRELSPIVFACALGCLWPPGATAQEPGTPPAKLVQMRALYLREHDTLRADALRTHLQKIAALETTLRSRGDATGADQVNAKLKQRRDELARLSKELDLGSEGTGDSKPVEHGPVILKPNQAEIGGSLKRSRSYLLNWTTVASNATWNRRDLKPGKYDIFIDYYPIRGGGGTLELRDLHQSATIKIPAATKTPTASSVKAATFQFKSSISLKLSPTGRGRNGIFYLRGIRLVPVKSS